jgi:hypothetical protein
MSNSAGGPVNPPLPDPAFPVVNMPLASHSAYNAVGLSRRAFATAPASRGKALSGPGPGVPHACPGRRRPGP